MHVMLETLTIEQKLMF